MSKKKETPYEVLGIRKDASDDIIKKAYKELAKKFHPDKNPGNEEFAVKRFREIQEAYDILKNEHKRKVYDETGETDTNTTRSTVVSLLRHILEEIFNQLSQNRIDPTRVDLIAKIKKEIQDAIKEQKQHLKETEIALRDLKRSAHKFKQKKDDEDNIIKIHLMSILEEKEFLIKQMEQSVRNLGQVVVFLEDYEYEYDKQKEMDPQNFFGKVTMINWIRY